MPILNWTLLQLGQWRKLKRYLRLRRCQGTAWSPGLDAQAVVTQTMSLLVGNTEMLGEERGIKAAAHSQFSELYTLPFSEFGVISGCKVYADQRLKWCVELSVAVTSTTEHPHPVRSRVSRGACSAPFFSGSQAVSTLSPPTSGEAGKN